MEHNPTVSERIKELRRRLGPELIEILLELGPQVPQPWRGWAPDRGLEYLRCRLRFSQRELAQKSGLSQSRLSLIEGGADARLSTWREIYRAMGFELMLLPLSAMDLAALEKFAARGRPQGHWLRTPARPRRRWLRQQSGPLELTDTIKGDGAP